MEDDNANLNAPAAVPAPAEPAAAPAPAAPAPQDEPAKPADAQPA